VGLAVAGLYVGWTLWRHRLLRKEHTRLFWGILLLFPLVVLVATELWPGIVPDVWRELASLFRWVWSPEVGKTQANIWVRLSLWEDALRELRASTQELLFGVGFAKEFVPTLADRLTSPTYGPFSGGSIYGMHNSQLNMLYRIGIVGMMLYAGVVWHVLRRGARALDVRRTGATWGDRQRLLHVWIMASFVYMVGHSLADVVMESPYRAVVYWFFLGLCDVSSRQLMMARSTPN